MDNLTFDDLIPQNGANQGRALSFDDLIPQQAPNPAFFNPDGSPRAVLSAGPEPSSFQRLIDSLQEVGLIPKGQANQIRRNSNAVGAAVRGARQGLTFGFGDEIAAGIDAASPSSQNFLNLDRALEHSRNAVATDRQNHPTLSAVGEIGGGVATGGVALKAGLTASRFIPQAAQGLRGALARGGAAAADGAVIGATQAAGDQQNVAQGALTGAALAGGLQGGAEAITGVAGNVARRIQQAGLSPEQRGQQRIFDAVQQQGGNQAVQQKLNELGYDAVLADVLPNAPRALRKASNLSPEAQQVAQQRLAARQSGQNERLIDDLNQTVGLNGNQTVGDIQNSIRERFRPRVNKAYRRANEAGAELPREPFRDILQTPIGNRAFTQAQRNVQNDIPIRENADSDLSILDETIRNIRDRAQALTQSGQRNQGARNFGLASELRSRVDDALSGGEFQAARALRQRQGQREDAVQAGADLSTRPNRENLQNVQNLDRRFQANAQQGFVADLTDRISQARNNASVRQRLDSPAGQQIIQSLFNPQQQQQINRSFARENTFANTLNQLRGNSTTAQQGADLADPSLLENVAQGASNLATGGIFGALRSGGQALARGVASGRERAISPAVADILTRNQIPQTAVPSLTADQLAQRQAIIELLSRGAVAGTSGF